MTEEKLASPQSSGKSKGVIKYTLTGIIGGLLSALLAAAIGVLTSSYVEISFKKPSGLDWKELLDLHVDVIEPKRFHAFYSENRDGKTSPTEAEFSLSYFQLTKKILGTKERTDNHAVYSITGFWKDELLVMDHKGVAGGGEGLYVLRALPLSGAAKNMFFGYTIFEDWKRGSEDWFIKCPILLIPDDVAQIKYRNYADLQRDFPFATTKCVEFGVPRSIDAVVTESKSIDEVLAK